MMELWKVLLIVFSIYVSLPLFYFIIMIIVDEFKYKFYQAKCESSFVWVNNNVGLYTIVDGLIGAGKTTIVSGIIHYLTISLMNKAQEKIEYVKYKFSDVDFNLIDQIIEHLYSYGYHNGEINIDHVNNSQLISMFILSSSVKGTNMTYEDIFGGPIVYKKTTIDLSTLEFKNVTLDSGKTVRVATADELLVDEEGYILDPVTYERISEYIDVNEVQFDAKGNIVVDKFIKPVRTFVEGSSETSVPKRDLVYIDTCLSYLSGYRYLLDYIEAYIALLQNNYVSFQDHLFYNYITHNYSMNLSEDFLNFRDRYISRDFDICAYHIYFLDEKNMDSISKSTSVMTYVQLDGGGDDLLRLWRHVTKGNSYYISTTQKSGRVNKPEREIGSAFLHIIGRKELLIRKTKYKFFSFIIKILKLINSYYESKVVLCKSFSLKKKLKNNLKKYKNFDKNNPPEEIIKLYDELKSKYSNKVSNIRKLISSLIVKQEWIKASGVLYYTGVLYYDADDVVKSNLDKTKYKEFKLLFPIRYCYGPLDTHRFYYVGDELRRRSIYFNTYYQCAEAYNYSLDDIQALVGVFAIKYPIKAALLKQIIDESKEALGLIESKKSKFSNNDECIETDLDDVL